VDAKLHQFVRAAETPLRPDGTRAIKASESALNAVLVSLKDLTAFWGDQTDYLSEILSIPDALPKHKLGELEQKWGRYVSAIQAGISSISASSDAATVDAVGALQAPSRKGIKPGRAPAFWQSFLKGMLDF
jgi:hypothetical protein